MNVQSQNCHLYFLGVRETAMPGTPKPMVATNHPSHALSGGWSTRRAPLYWWVAPELSSRCFRSLTARSCMKKERQMKVQGKIKSDERKVHRYPPTSPLPTGSPLPLSTMGVAPLPCSPTPRLRCPLCLSLPPVDLTSFRYL